MSDINYRMGNGKLTLGAMIDAVELGPAEPYLRGTRKSDRFSPSLASAEVIDPISDLPFTLGTCLRKIYYEMQGKLTEEVPDARMSRIRRGGELLAREFVYDTAKKAGIYANEEVPFYDPVHNLSGRVDLFVDLPGSGISGVEVKSMGNFMEYPHFKGNARGYTFTEPVFDYIPQTLSYMQHFYKLGVKAWFHYYIERGSLNTVEYLFRFDEKPDKPLEDWGLIVSSNERTWTMPWITWGQVKARWMQLKEYLDTNTTPPRDYALTFSNRQLLEYDKWTGKGSQMIPLGITQGKAIQSRYRAEVKKTKVNDPDAHAPYGSHGDKECSWCPFKTLCWTGLEKLPPAQASNPVPEPPKVEANGHFIRTIDDDESI